MTLGRSQTMIDQVGGASPLPSIQTHMHYLPLSHTTAVFPQNQLYVVFAAENSGMQLGSYVVSHSNHLDPLSTNPSSSPFLSQQQFFLSSPVSLI